MYVKNMIVMSYGMQLRAVDTNIWIVVVRGQSLYAPHGVTISSRLSSVKVNMLCYKPSRLL